MMAFWTYVKIQLGQFFFVGPGELRDFLSSTRHSALFSHYRARFILSRVRMMVAVFAVLTPLWMAIDFSVFPGKVAFFLAGGRIVATILFAFLAIFCRCGPKMGNARLAVGILLAVPTSFFLFSRWLLAGVQLNAFGTALASGYTFLPFVLATGLALFPFVALETMLFSVPMLIVFLISEFAHGHGILPGLNDLVVFWLLLLISAVSSMASLSQLQLMKSLFKRSSVDPLTRLLNRRSGEQFLQLQLAQAKRQKFPLTLAFIDLDNFKTINDLYGHEMGDAILLHVADQLQSAVRVGDVLIRWGGEEFLIVMPYATLEQAEKRLTDITRSRILQRPDGTPLTWSGGLAQWPRDSVHDWQELVSLADTRMYHAKESGKAKMMSQ
uniref:FOG: GGDEF domain n=1 Tax=mine drainage metagenome TaxID=410659 RepID=E6QTK1_9ZZZZ